MSERKPKPRAKSWAGPGSRPAGWRLWCLRLAAMLGVPVLFFGLLELGLRHCQGNLYRVAVRTDGETLRQAGEGGIVLRLHLRHVHQELEGVGHLSGVRGSVRLDRHGSYYRVAEFYPDRGLLHHLRETGSITERCRGC